MPNDLQRGVQWCNPEVSFRTQEAEAAGPAVQGSQDYMRL